MRVHRLIRPILCAIVIPWCAVMAGTGGDQCLTCHEEVGGPVPALFRHDIHFTKKIPCSGCHGGNPATDDMARAMDSTAGFIGVPKGDAISKMCARCHSDAERMKTFGSSLPLGQWESLQASVHGKLSSAGGEHAVQCITCHNAHGIVPVRDPSAPVYPLNVVKKCTGCHASASFMRSFNPSLAVDQLEKYRTSVHGARNANGDIKTAQCASCHGSHAILRSSDVKSRVNPANLPGTCSKCHSDAAYMKEYGIPTDQYEKYAKSVHGIALLKKHDTGAPACNSCHGNHGAAPPGVASISNVCGTCHALNADLFAESPHKKAFDAQGLPECETCHSNHEIVAAQDTMLGVSSEAVCSTCHSATENPKGFAAARNMRSLVDSLNAMEGLAGTLVEEAEQKGMEIGEAKFKLRDVRQARLETRTIVHAFNEAKFRPVAEKGFMQAGLIQTEARGAIREFYFRRIGLGVSSLIITVLAVCLWLLIRRIDRKGKAEGASPAP
jgi:predicted CXXCH cytochrome family protein